MNMNEKRIEFQALNGAYGQREERGSEGATRRVVKLLRVLIPAVCISIMLIGCDDAGNTAAAGVYACTNGETTRTGSPDGSADVQACNTCTTGYKLMGTANAPNSTCVAAVYTCINGATTRTDKPNGNTDAQACNTCVTGYELMGTANEPNTTCVEADTTAPTISIIPLAALTDIGVTITVNTSETGKLFWVLYANTTPPPATAMALITAAGQTPSGTLIANSGSDGQTVTTIGAQTVPITGLSANTNYDVYLVAQDAAGNNSAVSAKFDVLTNAAFLLHTNGITVLCPNAAVGATGTVGVVTYTKRTTGIIAANAATTCTSGITNMSNLFKDDRTFNKDIGSWDVSSVTDMSSMFFDANAFNQNIGSWDVSKVTNMTNMIRAALRFNKDIGSWDVSSVTNMSGMFISTSDFNKDIGSWDVSSVTNMDSMFTGAAVFNQDLTGWCVSEITSRPTTFTVGGSLLTSAHEPKWGDGTVASCPS